MTTLFDPAQRRILVDRLGKLTPETKPAWGKLTARNLLPHLSDPIRSAFGEYDFQLSDQRFYKTKFGRWLLIYGIKKWPKSPPTAPQFDSEKNGRKGSDFEKDRAELFELIERFGQTPSSVKFKPHAVFGDISHKSWGHLMHKHIEHHCKQFGL
ncbi:MAG TPA: DUF1569 domain-containing protein [Bacteroidia bacterium]|nr:DUF1569 domain-containing protein [Bacteroidia bacterium]